MKKLLLLTTTIALLSAKTITFGMAPVASNSSSSLLWKDYISYLQKESGMNIKIYNTTDYASTIVAMQNKKLDCAYLGVTSYVSNKKRANLELIAVDTVDGVPGYFGIIISKKGKGLKTVEALKGKTFAFTDPSSTSGTTVPKTYFHKAGIVPKKYFKRVIYSGNHEASILSVKAGRVDAASTNDIDFGRGIAIGKWKKDDFNIVWKSKRIPGEPIACRASLDSESKQALQKALLSTSKAKERFKKLGFDGWVKAEESDYNPVRDMLEFLKHNKD